MATFDQPLSFELARPEP